MERYKPLYDKLNIAYSTHVDRGLFLQDTPTTTTQHQQQTTLDEIPQWINMQSIRLDKGSFLFTRYLTIQEMLSSSSTTTARKSEQTGVTIELELVEPTLKIVGEKSSILEWKVSVEGAIFSSIVLGCFGNYFISMIRR